MPKTVLSASPDSAGSPLLVAAVHSKLGLKTVTKGERRSLSSEPGTVWAGRDSCEVELSGVEWSRARVVGEL